MRDSNPRGASNAYTISNRAPSAGLGDFSASWEFTTLLFSTRWSMVRGRLEAWGSLGWLLPATYDSKRSAEVIRYKAKLSSAPVISQIRAVPPRT